LWCWNDTSATVLAQAMVDLPQKRRAFWLSGYPFGVNHKIHTGSVLQRIKWLARRERQNCS